MIPLHVPFKVLLTTRHITPLADLGRTLVKPTVRGPVDAVAVALKILGSGEAFGASCFRAGPFGLAGFVVAVAG